MIYTIVPSEKELRFIMLEWYLLVKLQLQFIIDLEINLCATKKLL